MPVRHFLIIFDRQEQQIIEQCEFDDPTEAVQEYETVEELHRHDAKREVVLLSADSIESIRITHGNYFQRTEDTSPYLALA